jgi:hypothetical protein
LTWPGVAKLAMLDITCSAWVLAACCNARRTVRNTNRRPADADRPVWGTAGTGTMHRGRNKIAYNQEVTRPVRCSLVAPALSRHS